ncbi:MULTISPECIES: APC family permease [Streptacidiphilus]|uniref:APC family permease n=2 Tax=Streptacidiphilus TaxID=228398 RepID=A0ABV6UUB1_9ACTN|nr:APC family permease [Streptacidiphilus jeojiense]
MEPELRRGTLGTGDIAFFVISAAAPLMILAGVAPYAILVGGIGAPSAYLIAGIVLTVFAVGFTTMSRYVSNAGAFYAYITKGLGRPAGVAAAVLALVSYNGVQIGMYGLLGSAAQSTVQSMLGVDIPWPYYALTGVALVWFAGYRSIEFGARLLGVLMLAESGILVLLAVAVLLKGGAHGLDLRSYAPKNVFNGSTSSLLVFAFAAFMGFESTAIYRSEARDPRRTIPRATYIAVAFLGLFYSFVAWAIIQGFGSSYVQAAAAKDPAGLVFTEMDSYVGTWATDTMHVLILSSSLASLLAFHNAINRYTKAIADEGMLPARLASVHPRTGSPHLAGGLQTLMSVVVVTAFAVAGLDPYLKLLFWVNTPGVIGLVLLQVGVAIAVPVYFRRIDHDESVWRTVVAPVLAAIGMVTALYLMISKISLLTGASGSINTVLVGLVPVVIVAGLGLALWLRAKRPQVYARLGAEPPVVEEEEELVHS